MVERLVNRRFVLFAAISLASPLLAEKPAKAFAIVSGTVFREPGFALAGAEIEMQPDAVSAASNKRKAKAMKAKADGRGEFSFRVPAEPMRYQLKFSAAGFAGESKTVSIQGEERQEVFVTLKSAKEATQ